LTGSTLISEQNEVFERRVGTILRGAEWTLEHFCSAWAGWRLRSAIGNPQDRPPRPDQDPSTLGIARNKELRAAGRGARGQPLPLSGAVQRGSATSTSPRTARRFW
jgi:hypothetical protein